MTKYLALSSVIDRSTANSLAALQDCSHGSTFHAQSNCFDHLKLIKEQFNEVCSGTILNPILGSGAFSLHIRFRHWDRSALECSKETSSRYKNILCSLSFLQSFLIGQPIFESRVDLINELRIDLTNLKHFVCTCPFLWSLVGTIIIGYVRKIIIKQFEKKMLFPSCDSFVKGLMNANEMIM